MNFQVPVAYHSPVCRKKQFSKAEI